MKTPKAQTDNRVPEEPGLYNNPEEVDAYENEMGSGVVAFIENNFFKAILKQFGHLSNIKVLDLGAGPAWITTKLAQACPSWKITGLDVSQLMLEKAKARSSEIEVKIEWVNADVRDTKLDSESYDLIISHFAFSEFPDPEKVVTELTRLLKLGGFLFIQDLLRPPRWQMPLLKAWRYITNPFGKINKQYIDSLKGAFTEEELNKLFSQSELEFKISTFLKFAGGIGLVSAVKPN